MPRFEQVLFLSSPMIPTFPIHKYLIVVITSSKIVLVEKVNEKLRKPHDIFHQQSQSRNINRSLLFILSLLKNVEIALYSTFDFLFTVSRSTNLIIQYMKYSGFWLVKIPIVCFQDNKMRSVLFRRKLVEV